MIWGKKMTEAVILGRWQFAVLCMQCNERILNYTEGEKKKLARLGVCTDPRDVTLGCPWNVVVKFQLVIPSFINLLWVSHPIKCMLEKKKKEKNHRTCHMVHQRSQAQYKQWVQNCHERRGTPWNLIKTFSFVFCCKMMTRHRSCKTGRGLLHNGQVTLSPDLDLIRCFIDNYHWPGRVWLRFQKPQWPWPF